MKKLKQTNEGLSSENLAVVADAQSKALKASSLSNAGDKVLNMTPENMDEARAAIQYELKKLKFPKHINDMLDESFLQLFANGKNASYMPRANKILAADSHH